MKKIFSPFLLREKQKRGKGGRQETETALYIDFVHGSKYSSMGKFTTSVNGCVLQASFCFSRSPRALPHLRTTAKHPCPECAHWSTRPCKNEAYSNSLPPDARQNSPPGYSGEQERGGRAGKGDRNPIACH